MQSLESFPIVSVGELGRNPSQVLARVRLGERFIVCCHRVPIATIQPLNSAIRQPFDPITYDIEGSSVPDLRSMAVALPPIVKDLLLSCNTRYNVDKFRSGHLHGKWPLGGTSEAFDQMHLRGLAKKTERGWVATGLGLALKDELRLMLAAGVLDVAAWMVDPTSTPPS